MGREIVRAGECSGENVREGKCPALTVQPQASAAEFVTCRWSNVPTVTATRRPIHYSVEINGISLISIYSTHCNIDNVTANILHSVLIFMLLWQIILLLLLMASTQIPLRLSLGRRQVEVDVHRVKNDVRRPVHFRRGRRLAVVASR